MRITVTVMLASGYYSSIHRTFGDDSLLNAIEYAKLMISQGYTAYIDRVGT